MEIDQDWVTNNIDLIMKEFVKIHPKYKKTDNASMASKSRERKNMLEDMDTMKYRPIYYICKTFPEKEKRIKDLYRNARNERDENEKHCRIWHDNYQRMKQNLINEFGKKSQEVEVALK